MVLEAQPSALRNREAISECSIKTRDLARCVLASIQGRLKYGLVPIAGVSAHALQITQNMGNRTTNVKP